MKLTTKLGIIGVVTATLGAFYWNFSAPEKRAPPTLKDFVANGQAQIMSFYQRDPKTKMNGLESFNLVDLDGDSQVDCIRTEWKPYASFVAEGYQDKAPYDPKFSQIMTPEMRKDASEALRLSQRLGFQISENRENYSKDKKGAK